MPHIWKTIDYDIFVAVGMDGSNCTYSISFGFTPKGTKVAWIWFVRRLCGSIEIREDFSLVTDCDASIPEVVREVFPSVSYVLLLYSKKEYLKVRHENEGCSKTFLQSGLYAF